jgi:uncharacterized protein YdcH (DUF465 family)
MINGKEENIETIAEEDAIHLKEERLTLDVLIGTTFASKDYWYDDIGKALFEHDMVGLIRNIRLSHPKEAPFMRALPKEFHEIAKRYIELDKKIIEKAKLNKI